jgi:Family of unknown function (DUF6131)
MLVLGIILWLIGYLTGIGLLSTLGIILIVIGLVFLVLGYAGHPVGGRRYWY